MKIINYTRISDTIADLAKIAASHEGGKDVYFIVPARPDMQMLKDILLEKNVSGYPKWHIWRWSDLFREIWSENRHLIRNSVQRRQIDPPDHWIIVRHIVNRFIDENDLCGNGYLPPGVRTKGFVSTLGSSLRELLREEVSPADLAASLGCKGCSEGNPCSHMDVPEGLLCRLFHSYADYLENGGPSGLFDSAQIATLTAVALEEIPGKNRDWISKKHFVFTGFTSFNHSQKNLVDLMEAGGARITIFSPENGTPGSYTVKDQFPDGEISNYPHEPLRYLEIAGGDKRLELESVARELILWSAQKSRILAGEGDFSFPGWENMAMEMPESYLSTATEVLHRYRIPCNFRGGINVSRTPLWELLRRIWDLNCDGWPGTKTIRLLCEPWFAGNELEMDGKIPSGRMGLIKYLEHHSKEGSICFTALLDFTDSLASGATPADILELVLELSNSCCWEKKLSSFVLPQAELDEKCRQFNGALREIKDKVLSVKQVQKDIGEAGSQMLKETSAFNYLSNWAKETTIRNTSGRSGSMDLYVGTPPVLAEKKVWILCGATSRTWPGSLKESPLLPDGRKDELHRSMMLGRSHLPLLSEQRKQKEMLFNRICACGKDLTILTYPLTDSSGRPEEPSPFIHRANQAEGGKFWMLPWSEDNILHRGYECLLPREGEILVGTEIDEKKFFFTAMEGRKLPSERTEVAGDGEASVSLSHLDTWIDCPFRYYCMYILKLGWGEVKDFDPMKAGEALHLLWRRAWHEVELHGGSLSEKGLLLFEDVFKEVYPALFEDPSLKRHISRLKEQVLAVGRIQEEMETGEIRDTKRPSLFELDLPEFCVQGVNFRGRLDRLDFLKDGSGIICDYKSGKSSNYNNSMQLASYVLLFDKGLKGDTAMPGNISGYCYICHGDGRLKSRASTPESARYFKLGKRSGYTLEKSVSEAEEILEAMAASIREGIFEPDYDSDACRFCDFSGLCRKKENTLSGKNKDDNDENTY